MRVFMILCWLTVPLLAWAYHVGPGQQQLATDRAGSLARQATDAVDANNFDEAASRYAEALASLPSERRSDSYSIRLALAQSQMQASQLPEARVALEALLDEFQQEQPADVDKRLVKETRNTLASAEYFMTWLMRLEGQPVEEWESEIESARQHYRKLAEDAKESGDTPTFERHQHDLEAAIRLARMDLAELQALKLPSQCKGCCSGQCKKVSRKQMKRKSEKKGAGANLGPLPDGSGS
jgi:tetratricopeptide (TPR) repeat protein